MSDDDDLLINSTTKIFEDLCDPQTINSAKDDSWKSPLWKALEESGLTLAWVPENCGGSGASLSDGFHIAEVAGRFASPIPLAETLLAGWLLSKAEIQCPPGMLTIAPIRSRDTVTVNPHGTLSGQVKGVPFASEAEHIAIMAKGNDSVRIGLVAAADCAIQSINGLSGDSRDLVNFDNVEALKLQEPKNSMGAEDLILLGAAVRSTQIGGALQTILTLTTDYSKERIAFEKPISKFQAVQHNLAKLASETAAAIAAASSAADTIANSYENSEAVFFETAAAKIRTGEAVGEGAAIAHQVYGAIGFTEEHILHRFTQRLWDWRNDFDSESEWAVQLGEMVAKKGAEELWPFLTTR